MDTGIPVSAIAWSSDGRLLAFGSTFGEIRVVDPDTAQEIHRIVVETDEGDAKPSLGDSVVSLGWSPEGRRLAITRIGGPVTVLDTQSGDVITRLVDKLPSGAMAWSPDGAVVATAGLGGPVKFWDVASGEVIRTLPEDTGTVRALAWSRDGHHLATSGVDGPVRLWTGDRAPGDIHPDGAFRAMRVSSDGRSVAIAGLSGPLRIWSVLNGKVSRTLAQDRCGDLTWVNGDRLLAVAAVYGRSAIWDARTGTLLHEVETGDGEAGLAWSPDGVRLAVSVRASIHIRDLRTLTTIPLEADELVHEVTWSPTGRYLAGTGLRVKDQLQCGIR